MSESRLDYSHRDVSRIPDYVIDEYESVTVLDVSNNLISDVSFTGRFKNLKCLILDHNQVAAGVIFPYIPTVHTLWLNFNAIDELIPFVDNLNSSFPYLKHLCMMGNAASPPCTEDTYYEYVQYRLKILSRLKNLDYLDDRPVLEDEREEAKRLYDRQYNLTDYVYSMFDKVLSFMDPAPVTGQSLRASVI